MPQRLFGYLYSSRDFMRRQLEVLESGRLKLMLQDEQPAVDVSDKAVAVLRDELKKVEELIDIYAPDDGGGRRASRAPSLSPEPKS